MARKAVSCCGTTSRLTKKNQSEIPQSIREELDRTGGLEALAQGIPAKKDLEAKSRIYHALSDPLRLSILHLLKDQPLCVCVINQFMQIANSKLSYHLTILKESDLITGEYQGNWIIYSLTDQGRSLIS
ncbi:MAG: metalloregulator ArsR/SmtB family transcription factor [Methanoregula sp.]|nr:metalloregulator ArsR/SmtB family transcription factor [Methanoregula sp.]